jgi:hypothetical protein
MDTATKTFLTEQFDSLREELATKKDLESLRKEFDLLHTEMVTKTDFNREVSSIREDIESLAEMTSRAFTTVNLDFVRLETRVNSLDKKIDDFVSIDYRGQIDMLRDDMRVIKTQLKIA